MKNIYFAFFIFNFFLPLNKGTGQTLDSTNLPIVFINTNFQSIPDEPKINAGMAIIDNGYNQINHVTDTIYSYYGNIGIEQRGSISQQWWWTQKSYAVETRNAQHLDTNAVILGMPKESDWVLYGPFNEATLMKNVLTYQLVRELGYYVTRTKYCEMMLKTGFTWKYNGIYVMMEKIKRDKNRVDIAKLDSDDNAGDSLTGGYIIAVDRNINVQDSGWFSSHPQNTNVFYTYKYPKGDKITPQQMAYIQAYVDSFEKSVSAPNFADPATGFRKFIEPVSFMDFFFIQELSKNIDAYKRSSYLYKDRNSKDHRLHAGPHWDYNSAYKIELAGCEPFDSDTGWVYNMTCWIHGSNYPVPFWWKQMLQDTTYTRDLKCRWIQLRSSTFSIANIFHIIDSIAGYISAASARHYQKFNITTNFQTNVNALKTWIAARLAWLDSNMPGNCWNLASDDIVHENSITVFPNPSNGKFTVRLYPEARTAMAEVYDIHGKKYISSGFEKGTCLLDISHAPEGIYLIRIASENRFFSKKIIISR